MGIDDSEVWDYSTAIRKIIETKELTHLKTLRISDLLDHEHTKELTRKEYLIHAGCYRRELVAKFGPINFDARTTVREDQDTCMTYRGYIKFLTKDMMYSQLATDAQNASNPKKRYKDAMEDLAYQMITRGKVSLRRPVSSMKSSSGYNRLIRFARLLQLPLKPNAKTTSASPSTPQRAKPSSPFHSSQPPAAPTS